MRDILDEGLIKMRKKVQLCARFRNITLVFTTLMVLLYLYFQNSQQLDNIHFLTAGFLSILIQALACYAVRKERNIWDTIRLTLIILATLALLSLSTRNFLHF